ncbi:MFS transporter [Siccirubricoccus sp. KC 17139]|uniref:MFS transporter n=1 Tax=Siccirubricoccus soli TaxID=2899147 RepID=A0ABT1D2E4_9PROT|nr:MFS transporter [Siccirubricoccus soli]MCO6416094.1 MFS transporter [Siccirubricoccus soli]MCP2682226.1 MFS transporter [Siccirubricoccus soli]
MTAGSLAAGLGLAAASQVAALWQLYAAWAAIGAVMAFTLYEAAFAAVAVAFGRAHARRGIAAVTLAGGLASTLSWPLVALAVDGVGWRSTLLALAAINMACATLHWLFLPDRPASDGGGQHAAAAAGEGSLGEILRQPSFWWLGGSMLLMASVSASMAVHLVPALSSKDMSAGTALAVAALMGPMQVAGRLLERTVARRAPLRAVGIAAMAIVAVSLASLGVAGGLAAAAAAVVAYGAANGVLAIVRGAIPAELFGTRAYASAIGILAAANAVAAAVGPVTVAWLWNASGSYALPLLSLAALAGVGLVAFAAATRPTRPHNPRGVRECAVGVPGR